MQTERNNFDNEVFLIGIRMGDMLPECYTLVICGEKDVPLVFQEKFIFFSSITFIEAAFEMLDDEIKQNSAPPKEISLTIDVPLTVKMLQFEKVDQDAVILNCLNTIMDFVDFNGSIASNNFRKILNGLADHLTFHSNFDDFMEKEQIPRQYMIDAILWCVGTIVAKGKIL